MVLFEITFYTVTLILFYPALDSVAKLFNLHSEVLAINSESNGFPTLASYFEDIVETK